MITYEKEEVEKYIPLKRSNKKTIIFIISIISIIILVLITIPFIIKYSEESSFNQKIIKNENVKIVLNDITELKLWNKTINNLKSYEKYIEIEYEHYKIKLNTEKLEIENELDVKIEKKVSSYEELKNQEIVEIDMTAINPMNIIQEITINTEEYLEGLKKIDIYAIKRNDKTLEYIDTRDIQEKELGIELKEEYEKYILVYIPIKDIMVEKEYIEILKGEKYQMTIDRLPENSTIKMIDVEMISNPDIINLYEDGVIEGVETGTMEFYLKAENDTVKNKITVVVKAIVEDLQLQKYKIDLTEGESSQIHAKILPEEVEDKRLKYESNNPEIVTVDEAGKIKALKIGKATITITTIAEPIQKKEVVVNVKQKKVYVNTQNSTNNQNNTNTQNSTNTQVLTNKYIKGVLVVNKTYTLPSNYNPGVNQEALQSFNNMKYQASLEGISLKIVSGYRSYKTQEAIFARNANLYGEEVANTFSARAGQSEHQTGLAFDINSTREDFKYTAEAKWLANNCHKYGFIIRYPEGKQGKTGYIYEPWHIRYLGVQTATEIKNLGVCLEEYLGI